MGDGDRLRLGYTLVAACVALVAAPASAFALHPDGTTLGPTVDVLQRGEAPPTDPAQAGTFSAPFAEPTIDGVRTDDKCLAQAPDPQARTMNCKPSAGSVNVLPDGDVFYWDNLEGTENVKYSIVAEYGVVSANDQSRRLSLARAPKWSEPTPVNGGANPEGYDNDPLFEPPLSSEEVGNDGALFCSDQNFLADGTIMAGGGTAYYADPGVNIGGQPLGVAELEGLRNTRIFHPETDTWTQADSMEFGRWYPTLVTLADGDQFVASGVKRLIKPEILDDPSRLPRNVVETETYDLTTGEWHYNGAGGDLSLPLFARLHLLPNGDVFYNAAGQAFNPFGQAFDELDWNFASTYDPDGKTWTRLGIPGLDTAPNLGEGIGDPLGDLANLGIPGGGKGITLPGFRGSTFSVMMPLRPNEDGEYTTAEFLTAGGVLNPPSPGSYFATSDSRITTVETSGEEETMSTRATGDLGRPRWYPSSVLLPTGEVIAFSGADRDEVVAPGTEFPVKRAEMFDPETEEWSPLAEGHNPRTYHNTAALLPSGKILIGGHAPISTLYTSSITLAPGLTAPNNGRDPSFEVYKPPYLFRGERPRIKSAPESVKVGKKIPLKMKGGAKQIETVVMVRNASQTHVTDADQRSVELEIVRRKGKQLKVKLPPSSAVLPPGPYMIFANRSSDEGPIPSPAAQTFVQIGR